MTKGIKTRMNTKSMKQQKTLQIISLLNDLDIVDRIEIIERIGKRLRQSNSIESAKEVQKFATRGQQIKKNANES